MSDLKLETLEQKASYGIGRQMGDQLAQQPFEGMDLMLFLQVLLTLLTAKRCA